MKIKVSFYNTAWYSTSKKKHRSRAFLDEQLQACAVHLLIICIFDAVAPEFYISLGFKGKYSYRKYSSINFQTNLGIFVSQILVYQFSDESDKLDITKPNLTMLKIT